MSIFDVESNKKVPKQKITVKIFSVVCVTMVCLSVRCLGVTDVNMAARASAKSFEDIFSSFKRLQLDGGS